MIRRTSEPRYIARLVQVSPPKRLLKKRSTADDGHLRRLVRLAPNERADARDLWAYTQICATPKYRTSPCLLAPILFGSMAGRSSRFRQWLRRTCLIPVPCFGGLPRLRYAFDSEASKLARPSCEIPFWKKSTINEDSPIGERTRDRTAGFGR